MILRRNTITWLLVNSFVSQVIILITIFSCSSQLFCLARDTIEYGVAMKDNGETLVSEGEIFELGFFTPNGSSSVSRYVGIWYKSFPDTVVWVANRDRPIVRPKDGLFGIRDDGNLQVWNDSTGESHWSTNIQTFTQLANLTAKLTVSGNLVLGKITSSLWESFKNPTDTFLPGMVMDAGLELTSWREIDDPAVGKFIFKRDDQQSKSPQYVIMKGSVPYWKSEGKFASQDNIPATVLSLLSNTFSSNPKFKYTRNSKDKDYNGTRLVMTFDGRIVYQVDRNASWSEPANLCSTVDACGDWGVCNAHRNNPSCKCLRGFKPSYPEQWDSGDYSGGCTRRGTKPCGQMFLNLTMMDLGKPESLEDAVEDEAECKSNCLESCQCQAYSFQAAPKTYRRVAIPSLCSIWTGALRDIQEEYEEGRGLFVRVSPSDLETEIGAPPQPSEPVPKKSSTLTPHTLIIVTTVASAAVLVCTFICFLIWKRKATNRSENRRLYQRNKEMLKLDTQKQINHLMNSGGFVQEDEEGIDVPFFDLDSIIAATDNFSDANKLGQGGYGPVYKAIFPGGQEIAVKRLSSVSGQGLEEFKNEVVLIAKLQHRNLVRLRGYCIKGDEKILLYEYMPNRSLDSFIFGNKQSITLDWEKRFSIILGIARGLLYLHQDSRLRIIHRDFKTSNILLDEDMEPKISDFGLARIVGGKQTEVNTNRVVGTYGYMSPEYAMDGLFSVKSDVFSFGVVLLEIISGKRNSRVAQSELLLSLLGYAWRLWTENKVMDLMDPDLYESCIEDQFLKCAKVGLLCVQEDPSERPTMSTVLTMLDSESASIPNPHQPAFVLKRGSTVASSSTSSTRPEQTYSEITITLEGR